VSKIPKRDAPLAEGPAEFCQCSALDVVDRKNTYAQTRGDFLLSHKFNPGRSKLKRPADPCTGSRALPVRATCGADNPRHIL